MFARSLNLEGKGRTEVLDGASPRARLFKGQVKNQLAEITRAGSPAFVPTTLNVPPHLIYYKRYIPGTAASDAHP